jgi:hypothetical protein
MDVRMSFSSSAREHFATRTSAAVGELPTSVFEEPPAMAWAVRRFEGGMLLIRLLEQKQDGIWKIWQHRKHVFPKKEIGCAPTVQYMHLVSIIHVEPEREWGQPLVR